MLIRFEDLKEIQEKHQGQKIVLAGGAFDILHQGHIDFLRDTKALGDILVIAIKTDAEVRDYKDLDRPIQNEDVRAAVIDAIRYVDYTVISPEPPPNFGPESEPPRMAVARELHPNLLVTYSDRWEPRRAALKELGTELKIVPINKVNSTTSIIERIRSLRQ
jgi:rfaE bifunctional protein nucleotidyltransferase chain/domain